MTCLYTGTWRFFEPNKWQDKYERRFYCADYQFPNAHEAAPKLFATCVTRERNSEASWKVYAGGTGLSQHCLQLELNLVEFRKQLQASDFQLSSLKKRWRHTSMMVILRTCIRLTTATIISISSHSQDAISSLCFRSNVKLRI